MRVRRIEVIGHHRTVRGWLLLAAVAGLAGCAGAASFGWLGGLIAGLGLTFTLVACDTDRTIGENGDPCCISGRISTCECPPNVSCNYGRFTDCGGGNCSTDPGPDPCGAGDGGGDAAHDGSTDPDSAGTWERCCDNGRISSCYCPAGMACNYGWFTPCPDGTCVLGRDAPGKCSPADDAGPPDAAADASGRWYPCCLSERVSSCYCPPGAACNYGPFDICADRSCRNPPQSCPVDAGPSSDLAAGDARVSIDASADASAARDLGGTWQTCCVSGRIDTCFCPAGATCNYGLFQNCGGGRCVMLGQACPP